jgi:hypothetical protein
MSYFLVDAGGHLGDFASTGGLRSLLARDDLPALQEFLDRGEADEALRARLAEECAGDRECDYLARLLRDAEAPVILTDGLTDRGPLDDEEEDAP